MSIHFWILVAVGAASEVTRDPAARAVDGDISAASCSVAEQDAEGTPITWSVDLQSPTRMMGAVVHIPKPDVVTGTSRLSKSTKIILTVILTMSILKQY